MTKKTKLIPCILLSSLMLAGVPSISQASAADPKEGQKPKNTFVFVGGSFANSSQVEKSGKSENGVGVDALVLRKILLSL